MIYLFPISTPRDLSFYYMLGANLGSISLGDVSMMLKWLWSSDAKIYRIKINAKGDNKKVSKIELSIL